MKRFYLALFIALVPLGAQGAVLDVQTVRTDKNITAWLVEDKTVPVVSMQFAFLGAGAVNDPDDRQGVSQLLSNTLDEGAGDLDAEAFQAALNNHSVQMSFSSSRDDFGGSLKTLTKYQDRAFELLHMALTKPRFEEEALERMKQANIARIRNSMTDPEWLAARLSNAVLFKGHPYARNSGGTLSSLPKITATDLRNKLASQLGRDRLIIAVAGNITKEELARQLDRIFGDLPATSRVAELQQVEWKGVRTAQYIKDIPQSVIGVSWPGIKMDDPDYFAAEIFNYILGGAGFGSRLTEVIREQRGLTYGIYSDLSEMDAANLLSIGTSTRSEQVGEILTLIDAEAKKIAVTPVSESELGQAKSYLIGSVPLGLTSTDRIAGMMISFQSFGLPVDYLDVRERALEKVTAQDVMRVASRLLDSGNKILVLVGKDAKLSETDIFETLPDIE